MKRAIFPGSFDPITLGHYDIIKRGVTLFDEIIVAIGVNSDKKYMFSLEERKQFIEEAFKDYPKVKAWFTYLNKYLERNIFLYRTAILKNIASPRYC